MSLSQIRNRINALRRKYAIPLAVNRLRPLAEEFSHARSKIQGPGKSPRRKHSLAG